MASLLTFRSLLRSPALALGVAATLAVGVAALSVTFGIVNAALFREPPFERADRLAALYIVRNPIGEPPQQRQRWSFPRYELLRDTQRSFESVASYSNPSFTLSGSGEAELVYGEEAGPVETSGTIVPGDSPVMIVLRPERITRRSAEGSR